MSTKILTKNMHVENLPQIETYESLGGYTGLAKALRETEEITGEQVLEILGVEGRSRESGDAAVPDE